MKIALALLAPAGLTIAICSSSEADGRANFNEERARHLAMLTPEYQKLHGCRASQSSKSDQAAMPLIDGLARVHLGIRTIEAAQRFFDQGLALLYGFEHAKAERSFDAALTADPNCAMCRWGKALAMGPHINSGPMSAERATQARALVDQMLGDPALSPIERELGLALRARYAPDPPAARKGTDEEAYAELLRQAVDRHSGSDFLLVLAAEAAMNVQPWDYWEPGGRSLKPWGSVAMHLLTTVLDRSELHPQALHLFIHLTEASANPRIAEGAADRLRRLAPQAAHLRHMPGHIYYRIGRFTDAVNVNKQAIRADEAMARRLGDEPRFYNYFRHHSHFILSSAEQIGDRDTALVAATGLEQAIPSDRAVGRPDYRRMLASALQARFHLEGTDAVLAIPEPDGRLEDLRLVWRAVRVQALARANRLREARAEFENLRRQRAVATISDGMGKVVEIGERLAEARLLSAEGDLPAALRLYRQAEAIEAGEGYWEPPLWSQPVALHIGAAQMRAGDGRSALASFDQALERRPGNIWALRGVVEARRAIGRPQDDATRAYRRAARGPAATASLRQF